MHHRSRRGVALVAILATSAGGSLATVPAQASAADTAPQSAQRLGLLDGLLGILLGQIAGATVQTIEGLIIGLSPVQVGDLLQSAQPADVPNLLTAAQNNGQLVPALGTLNATETGDLLAPRTGTGLTTLLGALTNAQLTGALGTLTSAENAGLLTTANSTQLTSLLGGLTQGQLTGALGTLNPTQTGDLLAPLTGANLSTLLGALNTAQLTGALGTLTSAENAGLLTTASTLQRTSLLGGLTSGQLAGALDVLDPATLTAIVGGLTPAQISGLLPAGGTADVISGLIGSATALGGAPGAAPVDALVGQVTALLGGGIPAAEQVTGLVSLLEIVNPLLATTGLDTSLLSPLLTTVDGLLAGIVPTALTAPLQDLVTRINGVLNPAAQTVVGTTTGVVGTTTGVVGTTTGVVGTITGGVGTTTGGATTTQPAATTTRPGATQPVATQPAAQTPGPYRATLGTIKVSKRRTNAKFTLSCPMAAPKGCLVQVSAKIGGQKATRSLTVALPRGASSPVTVTLSRSTTKRLKKKGGSLKVTATTALSTLPSSTQTVKVKRPKSKRKTATR